MGLIRFVMGLAIAAWALGGSVASAQTVSVYGGGWSQGVALGASGELFTTNFVGDAVSRIPPGGGSPTTYVANAVQSPLGISLSPTGELYVSYELGGRVVRYPAGCVTPCAGAVIATPAAPTWLAMNAAGELYVGSYNSKLITRYAANCTAPCAPTVFASPAQNPAGLTFDADQNLYVALSDGTVQRFAAGCTTPCTGTAYATGLSTGIRGITTGENGSVYLTDTTARTVLRIPSGGGAAAVYATLPAGSVPRYLVRAPSGVIYVAGDNAIYAVSAPPVVVAVPTLTQWAMIVFGLLLAGGATLYIQRRRQIA